LIILVFAYFYLMHTVKARAVDRAAIQLDLLSRAACTKVLKVL
jgi:hypothetical protein